VSSYDCWFVISEVFAFYYESLLLVSNFFRNCDSLTYSPLQSLNTLHCSSNGVFVRHVWADMDCVRTPRLVETEAVENRIYQSGYRSRSFKFIHDII